MRSSFALVREGALACECTFVLQSMSDPSPHSTVWICVRGAMDIPALRNHVRTGIEKGQDIWVSLTEVARRNGELLTRQMSGSPGLRLGLGWSSILVMVVFKSLVHFLCCYHAGARIARCRRWAKGPVVWITCLVHPPKRPALSSMHESVEMGRTGFQTPQDVIRACHGFCFSFSTAGLI